MTCPSCKAEMVEGKTNLPYELGNDRFIVVKDVPALVCQQCSETYIEAIALRAVEKLIAAAEKDGMLLGFVLYQEAA